MVSTYQDTDASPDIEYNWLCWVEFSEDNGTNCGALRTHVSTESVPTWAIQKQWPSSWHCQARPH